jgi:drug/metabolite transporter (DMT)-like permease
MTQNTDNANSSDTKDNIIKGIAIITAGFFLVTLMGALSKMLTGIHHPIEIAFYRNLLAILFCIGFITTQKRYDLLQTKRPWFLLLRGMIGIIGLIACLSTMQALPVSTATVLFFASTLMVPIFATFILKEKVGIHRWAAVAIGMVGVIIVARPSPDITLYGVIIGLISACFIAFAHIILRFLRDENSLTVTMSYFVLGVILPAFFMPFIATMPTLKSALILLGIGITGGLFQYMLTVALKYAPASVINPFNYTGLLWATLFDITIFGNLPAPTTYIGAALIISANLYILYRERKKSKETPPQAAATSNP